MRSRSIFALFNRLALVIALLAALIGNAVHVTPAYAASIVVNTNADTDADDGVCTLREAIIAAVSDFPSGAQPGECAAGSTGMDTISFAANYTITVGSQLPFITSAITIAGKGPANTIIQASTIPNDAEWRVFQVTLNGNLTLDGVTVRHGRCNGVCTSFAGTLSNAGGGIYNSGTSTVNNSIISANRGVHGGGIYSSGTLTVTNSTISGNISYLSAGGIFSTGTLTVTNSTITGNNATEGVGGGINTSGTATVRNSTFARNGAFNDGDGGGIYNGNTGGLTVANSTFTNNSAGYGGGIANGGTLNVTNSTFAYNLTSGGNGILNFGGAILKNTVLASNSGENCDGSVAVADGGNNLDSGSTCGFGPGTGSLSDTDPMLGPLANNGGPTQTMKLLAGSPAMDNGRDTFCSAAPVNGVDQRGVTRPQGAHCDIGAYEYSGTFADVPLNYWAWSYVEGLYNAGITGGCVLNPLQYCPEATVTRAEMAVFLLRGIHGSTYNPPVVGTSSGFGDVPTTYWAAAWIKRLAAEGITGGCGSGNYCPEGPVTRAQMAIFLLRSYYGPNYTPPPVGSSTGFSDVPPNYWAAAWIKQLVAEGITSGCGTGLYCPDAPVTRAQMAVFLVRTFFLPTP